MHWIRSIEHSLLQPEADSIVGIYSTGRTNQVLDSKCLSVTKL